MPAVATPQASDLTSAVEISNRIREISHEAFLMRLEATNAIVMTRSRGILVPGFEAVSEQMGQISRELVGELQALHAATTAWIHAVSSQVGLAREVATLKMTRDAAPHAAAIVERVMRPLERQLTESAAIEVERRKFMRALDDVRTRASSGCVLARTAKIEASYGGELADVLGETAATFTELADRVDESVRTIARWISGSTRRGS